MTMRELAKIVNVSVSTVSKAFCDADDVSYDTKQLIFETAKKYGCYGKYYKGKYPKPIVAIICPEIIGGYYTEYVEKLQNIIETNGGIPVISTYNFDNSFKAELLDYYASHLTVDGIFVLGGADNIKKGYETPIVSVLGSNNNSTDCVTVDFKTPLFEAVDYLKDLGHKNIAFIGEDLTESMANIFCTALGGEDAKNHVFKSNLRFEDAGQDGARQILNSGNNYTAIICAYDDIAFGAIKHLKNSGYRIPEDISVVGIDNISISKFMETALTSIGGDFDEVCIVAWDLMQKKLKNKFYKSHQQITITGRLFLRETVGRSKE